MPIASVTLAPHAASSLRAHRRLAAARLAGDHHPADARLREVDAALQRPFGEMQGVGGRQRDDGRLEQLDRGDQPLGVAGADRECDRGRAG